jgi:NAD(P)H-dependent flavin oxidoreductase YrpB (nitropropane dioxygenase family)
MLGIRYPILNAGIGAAAGPELAAGVSNAGGFGVLGGGSMPMEHLTPRIERTRELTDKPFGVNVIIDHDDQDDLQRLIDHVAAMSALKPAAIILFWGDPSPFINAIHAQGVKALVQVGSVEEAMRSAGAGVDAIIAQGIEAGGHVRGTTSIWELLPAVVRAIKPIPVLASGGIGDGAGLASAIQFGAQGVSLGTRFVASEEAWLHPAYKQRVVEAKAEDTVYNSLYDVWWPNAPHRTLRNKTLEEWEAAGCPPSGKRPGEGTSIGRRSTWNGAFEDWPRYAIGTPPPDFDGDIEYAPLWAGESVSAVNDIKAAGEIVRDIVRDAKEMLAF